MMTREEFDFRTMTEFTAKEIGLINFNIYYNPECIEYYQNYQIGKYDKCYSFLKKNRHLLQLKYTPRKWKELARMNIKSSELLLR
jgi:hypothetical protein